MKRKEELRKARTTASSSRITSRSSSKSAFSTPDSPLTEYEEYEMIYKHHLKNKIDKSEKKWKNSVQAYTKI